MSSYFQDIDFHVIKQIQLSKSRLLIAVAWFTNSKIGDEILKKIGLDIEIIVDDNIINRNCDNLLRLQSRNLDLTFVKDLTKNYYLMHNKFCVIDNKIVVTGSYNWTNNANSNDENITIINDAKNAALYSQEFRRIKTIVFPNDSVLITNQESDELTELIYNELLSILKCNIRKLESGMFLNWTDEKIKNKIRVVDERLHNALINRIGSFGLYNNLIKKYGFKFNSLATENEKIEARDNFKNQGLDETEINIHREFQFFKLKAINNLLNNYVKIMNEKEPTKIDRLLNVFDFISKEKNAIANDIQIKII
ncbi:MAG TPA: phospholipase D-like domain-containing protein [Candidatus Paceibacterota bacterium]